LQQPSRGGFPVAPIERLNFQACEINAVNAAQIYGPHGWAHSGMDKWADAALFAEVVLSRHGAELVKAKVTLARQDAEVSIANAMPNSAFHMTDGTVAFDGSADAPIKLEDDTLAMA
jgi:hypothetical protein